jgi:hypothetical protein
MPDSAREEFRALHQRSTLELFALCTVRTGLTLGAAACQGPAAFYAAHCREERFYGYQLLLWVVTAKGDCVGRLCAVHYQWAWCFLDLALGSYHLWLLFPGILHLTSWASVLKGEPNSVPSSNTDGFPVYRHVSRFLLVPLPTAKQCLWVSVRSQR